MFGCQERLIEIKEFTQKISQSLKFKSKFFLIQIKIDKLEILCF